MRATTEVSSHRRAHLGRRTLPLQATESKRQGRQGGSDEWRTVRRKSGVEALEDDASRREEGLVFSDVEGDVPLLKRGDGVGNVVGDAVGSFVVFG